MNEGSDNLERVNAKVDSNSTSIQVLKNSVVTLEARREDHATSYSSLPASSSGCSGASFAEALAQQTRFNMALSLGHSPMMFFGGELHKYVQFVTMFRNSFDKTINDPVALYRFYHSMLKVWQKQRSSHVFLAPLLSFDMKKQ